MIINPQHIVEAGILRRPEGELSIAQNGIDLHVRELLLISAEHKYLLGDSSGECSAPLMVACDARKNDYSLLPSRAYAVSFEEIVSLPAGLCAFVLQRSTLNRVGLFLTGSVYDAGFQGEVRATLYSFSHVLLSKGMRLAQIVFHEAGTASLYQGQYQNEGLPPQGNPELL